MERASGVLLHISSLPNKYGIGSFGQSAYEFINFLKETGQKYWQILPLTTISYGDSPYQSFSAFAGNTHFIDFDVLIKEGYLEESDVSNKNFGKQLHKVDYNKVSYERRPLLEKAVAVFLSKEEHKTSEFEQFVLENDYWLITYAQYMTVKELNDYKPWYRWPEELRNYNKEYITHYVNQYERQMYYHLVTQYWFFKQWFDLKAYANQNNIQIIGDIPIYIARDSVEMWTQSELFLVDERKNPTVVSGVPPDDFSDDGQHWGNPIYDWTYMKQNDYKWWVSRMRESYKLYDVVRIDHFRGFESYWEIPSHSKTAATGQWKKGPGIDLFKEIKNQLGDIRVIAEDLGFITKEVIELREQTGFPGMKILQHGFSNTDSPDLIHNYSPDLTVWEEKNRFLEGTGSMILDHLNRVIYACRSERTDDIVFEEFYTKMNSEPEIFNAYDEEGRNIYHTNVMLSIGEKYAVICAESITDENRRNNIINRLKDSNRDVIEVSFEQMKSFCANIIEVRNSENDNFLIMSETAKNAFKKEQMDILERHCKVISSPLHSIEEAGGGSARCMIAEIF